MDRLLQSRRPAWGVILSALLLSLSCAGRSVKADRPSVILVSLCSVRADHLGCYGYSRNTSPHIDEMARQGTLFEYALTQWPKTAPAFSAIMTGEYGHTTGVVRTTAMQRLEDEAVTLAERLSESGYRTGAFLSSSALSRHLNIQQGFDRFEETWRPEPGKRKSREDGYEAAWRRALAWLAADDSPAFAWIHFNHAHYPYQPAIVHDGRFLPDSLPAGGHLLPVKFDRRSVPGLPPDHPCRPQVTRPDLGAIHKGAAIPRTPGGRDYHRDTNWYVAQYDACIRSADDDVGRLLEEIDGTPFTTPPIVILIGDHGEALGKHDYWFEHGRFAYDDCLRVPWIVKCPGRIPEGLRIEIPVGTFSMGPTLLDWLGMPSADCEAPSLASLVDRGGASGDLENRPVFSEAGYEKDYMLAAREGDWKLIFVPNQRDREQQAGAEFELYHISSDSEELTNVAAEYPDELAYLRERLFEWAAPWREDAEALVPAGADLDPETARNLRALGYID